MDVDDRGVAGAPQHEVHHRRLVDRRIGIGLAHDGGDAAGRGRLARGREGLAIFRTGFADERTQVDQSRRDDLVAAVDDLGAFRHAGRADPTLAVADEAVGDQQITDEIEVARRIDDPCVGEQDGTTIREHSVRSRVAQIARQGIERGHAHRNPHLDLFADQRLRAIGDAGIDLNAPVHRARDASPAHRAWRSRAFAHPVRNSGSTPPRRGRTSRSCVRAAAAAS